MSWLQSLRSAVLPVLAPEPSPPPPPRPQAARKKPESPRVTSRVGGQVSSSGRKSVSGDVKVKKGPSTSSASLKLDEKGQLSGRLGQAFELKLGAHTLVLGASIDSDGDVKSQVKLESPLLKTGARRD